MRRALILIGACGIAAFAFGQVRGMDLLRQFSSMLNQADSLRTTYTITPLGGAPVEYTLELAKPAKARMESPDWLILSDGTELYTYDKQAKRFTKEPLQDASLRVLLSGTPFTFMWAPFFDAGAFNRTVDPVWTGKTERKGMTLDGVRYATGLENANKAVLYFERPSGVLRQGELDLVGARERTTYLMDTSAVEINASISDDRFMWQAPEGSKEVTKEEMSGDQWYTSLPDAINAAKKSKRLLFVDFYADW